MPIDPTGTPGGSTYDIAIFQHDNGVEFKVNLASIIPLDEGDQDEAYQSLINHLNAWPDLATSTTVTGVKVESESHAITPDEE